MITLANIVLPSFLTLASYGAQPICPVAAPPVKVYVKADASEIQLDNRRSNASLAAENIDSSVLSRHPGSYEVGGLARGDINMSQEVLFGTRTDTMTGVSCIWVDTVQININVDHKIFVANKYKPGSCMFRETYNHEIKHVNVDRQVVNKYIGHIRNQAQMAASTLGVNKLNSRDEINATKERLSNVIRQSVHGAIEKMQVERRRRQDAVDTIDEYNRVSEACKARY